MLFFGELSLVVSIVALVVGIVKKSSALLVISAITSIPIAHYFIGANNAWKYVGFAPVILFLLTIFIWLLSKKKTR